MKSLVSALAFFAVVGVTAAPVAAQAATNAKLTHTAAHRPVHHRHATHVHHAHARHHAVRPKQS